MKIISKYQFQIFIALSIILIGLVFWQLVDIYRTQFDGGFSKRRDAYGQFGDYIGGLLNPLVGLITVVLLGLSLHQARTGIELLNKQIESADLSTQKQLKLLQKDRDLMMIEYYSKRVEKYPEANHEQENKIIVTLNAYIDNELESVLFRRRNGVPSIYRPDYAEWLHRTTVSKVNDLDTQIFYEEEYVQFNLWGATDPVTGYWAEIDCRDSVPLKEFPEDQVVSKCKEYHSRAVRDVLASLGDSWNHTGAKFSPHPNIFKHMDELKYARHMAAKPAEQPPNT
jgi:hypothetical protein